VEDQQPAAGDLTVDAASVPAEADESATGAVDEIDSAAAESEQADGETDAEATTATEDGGARGRRPAGRGLAAAMIVAAVLFVGSAAFAGAVVQPYLADRATAATKLRVARAAANAITTLWTYTPDNMNTLADRAAAYLGGDFGAQYRKFVDGIVAPNKQAQITNSTEVTGAAVESLDDPNAVVMVFTNTTSTSPLTKNIPALKYLSYRLFMKRTNGRWLVTRMTTVTSLDVTPHL
jgi:Mce-associated membrane protein